MTLGEQFRDYVQASGFNAASADAFAFNAQPHFLAGAAAMAQLFALGSGPMLEELRGIRAALEEGNRLAKEIKL